MDMNTVESCLIMKMYALSCMEFHDKILKSISGIFTLAIITTHSIMHSISFIIVTKCAKFPISSKNIYWKSKYFKLLSNLMSTTAAYY